MTQKLSISRMSSSTNMPLRLDGRQIPSKSPDFDGYKDIFSLKRQSSAHTLSSTRTLKDTTYFLTKNHRFALSSDKQNRLPSNKDFSILIHPNFTKKSSFSKNPSISKNPSFSESTSSKDSKSSFEKICLSEIERSNRSQRNSSRSSGKRKKMIHHLFNFSRVSSSNRNSSAMNREMATSKDKYIQSFIETNKSQFSNTENHELTQSKHVQNSTKGENTLGSKKGKNVKSGLGLKAGNYEKIRQKMKRLKDLTEFKPFKRKPLKYKASEEEWNEIERVVRMVCKEEMNKRMDTDDTVESKLRESGYELSEVCRKVDTSEVGRKVEVEEICRKIEQGERKAEKVKQTKAQMVNDEQQVEFSQKLITNKAETKQETKKETKQKIKQETKQERAEKSEIAKKVSIPKPINENCLSPKRQQSAHIKNPIQSSDTSPRCPSLSADPEPLQPHHRISLSFVQFSSLLLIYEHTLYMVPSIINKVSEICHEYEMDYKLPIFLFFKQMCLNKKLIEAIFNQQPESFFIKSGMYDYSDVVKQIKRANANNISSLEQLLPRDDDKGVGKLVWEDSLYVLNGKESYEKLDQTLENIKKDFFSTNMKLIKKLLKRISKSATTNTKQFQVFLNYSSSFLNLSTVHEIIQKVLILSVKISQPDKNPTPEKQQAQIREFLYEDCKFTENKYLKMKEKVFEMVFDIQEEHKKIEKYYHGLIKELKSREEEFKNQN